MIKKITIGGLVASLSIMSCSTEVEATTTTTEEKTTALDPKELTPKPDTTIVNNYALYDFDIAGKHIAISPLPGKVNLDEDIAKITDAGITQVITLVSKEELEARKLPDFLQKMEAAGLTVYQSPIIDYGLPSIAQVDSILTHIQSCLDKNEKVLIHCMGGYGRSGTIMGCYANKYLQHEDPIVYVRSIRGADAIETEAQEEFVKNYN